MPALARAVAGRERALVMVSDPAGVSHLVGRTSELDRLTSLLSGQTSRLITLRGPVGIGKSALAAAALPMVAAEYGGAHFVDLDGLDAAGALAKVTAVTKGLPARRTLEGERRWMRELLFVDHAELLVGAGSALEAIAGQENVTMLAMSTQPLGRGATIQLAPLSLPETRRLLMARGVADRCPPAELDALAEAAAGNPLLVRLIAARLAVDPTGALVAGLRRQGGLLGSLTRLEGHGHLDAALPALSAFCASFSAEAVSAVTGQSMPQVEAMLADLLRFDLIRIDESASVVPAEPRYRMPRLVREYLAGARAKERVSVGERHAAHFASVARRAASLREECDDAAAMEVSAGCYDDQLAALRWMAARSPAAAARLAVDLLVDAHRVGDEATVVHSLEVLLQGPLPEGLRLEALAWLALLDSLAADAVQRVPRIKERLAACEALTLRIHDDQQRLLPLMVEMRVLSVLRDFERASRAATAGATIARRLGFSGMQGRFELGLATISHELGDHAAAEESAQKVLTRALGIGDGTTISYAALLLSRLPAASPSGPGGLSTLRTALTFARRMDDRQLQSFALTMLSLHTLSTSEPAAATRWLLERYELIGRSREWTSTGPQIILTMGLATRLGRHDLTAQLHGALQPWSALVLAGLPRALADCYHWATTGSHAALGEEFERQSRDGTQRSLEAACLDAVDYALGIADPSRTRTQAAPTLGGAAELTARELDVLHLLVAGGRNREIAENLVISPKTVMHHTSSIYRKLGVRGRAEATALAVRLGMVSRP